jgi:hypothetical protein
MEPTAERPDTAETLRRLSEWEITGTGLHPGGSNYVFVARLQDPEREPSGDIDEGDSEGALYAIYKPASGERPLRDFPYGTLHRRERASYLLSVELGWPRIPPTVVREGPHGEGSVQLFIDADHRENFFTMRNHCLELFEPVAMFDVLVHNADRKGGACLKETGDGPIWAIDHGLTFNPMARRRTVMFEFNGERYPQPLAADLDRALESLRDPETAFGAEMRSLMEDYEVESTLGRGERMLESGRFPVLDPNVNVPWPFV